MERLKTMVDLEIGIHVGELKQAIDEKRKLGSDWTTSILLAGDAKKEVIKHIKALRNYDSPIEGIKDTISVILYLKYLFKITTRN